MKIKYRIQVVDEDRQDEGADITNDTPDSDGMPDFSHIIYSGEALSEEALIESDFRKAEKAVKEYAGEIAQEQEESKEADEKAEDNEPPTFND